MGTKDTSIRVRLTKEQKDKLKIKSKLNKESVSSYILRKSLGEEMDVYRHIPDRLIRYVTRANGKQMPREYIMLGDRVSPTCRGRERRAGQGIRPDKKQSF